MSVPALTDTELAALLEPIGGDVSLGPRLAEWVELLTRSLVSTLGLPSPGDQRLIAEAAAEVRAEYMKVASDPARALGILPVTEGGKHARAKLVKIAQILGINPDTREGAAAIGDLAGEELGSKATRADAHLKEADLYLFHLLPQCIDELANWVYDREHFPSNARLDLEASGHNGRRWPAIEFARALIQLASSRADKRMKHRKSRVSEYLEKLVGRSDRALLDGLRSGRQDLEEFEKRGLNSDGVDTVVSRRWFPD